MMKPVMLAGYNAFRLGMKKMKYSGLKSTGICLLNRNMKLVMKKSSICYLGNMLISDGRTVFIVDENASLKIGEHVYFNEDIMISCKSKIEIGDHCLFGPNVKIFDNDHQFDANNGVKQSHTSKPIKIGKNCWIGSNVVILKGTEIGDNCVIGAGSVVSGVIPDGHIVKSAKQFIIEPIR